MIQAEFKDFLECAETNRRPSANAVGSGIVLAQVMEAIYESAKTNMPVSMEWSELELGGFNR
jgi:predicted dehydrogenase